MESIWWMHHEDDTNISCDFSCRTKTRCLKSFLLQFKSWWKNWLAESSFSSGWWATQKTRRLRIQCLCHFQTWMTTVRVRSPHQPFSVMIINCSAVNNLKIAHCDDLAVTCRCSSIFLRDFPLIIWKSWTWKAQTSTKNQTSIEMMNTCNCWIDCHTDGKLWGKTTRQPSLWQKPDQDTVSHGSSEKVHLQTVKQEGCDTEMVWLMAASHLFAKRFSNIQLCLFLGHCKICLSFNVSETTNSNFLDSVLQQSEQSAKSPFFLKRDTVKLKAWKSSDFKTWSIAETWQSTKQCGLFMQVSHHDDAQVKISGCLFPQHLLDGCECCVPCTATNHIFLRITIPTMAQRTEWWPQSCQWLSSAKVTNALHCNFCNKQTTIWMPNIESIFDCLDHSDNKPCLSNTFPPHLSAFHCLTCGFLQKTQHAGVHHAHMLTCSHAHMLLTTIWSLWKMRNVKTLLQQHLTPKHMMEVIIKTPSSWWTVPKIQLHHLHHPCP